MGLTQGRNTPYSDGVILIVPLAAKTIIYSGAMVAINRDGNAIPAKKMEGITVIGRAEQTVDNLTGVAGEQSVKVKRGAFTWENDSTPGNQVTAAHLMQNCYIVDDCTVTSVAAGSSVAGRVLGITGDSGVIVETI